MRSRLWKKRRNFKQQIMSLLRSQRATYRTSKPTPELEVKINMHLRIPPIVLQGKASISYHFIIQNCVAEHLSAITYHLHVFYGKTASRGISVQLYIQRVLPWQFKNHEMIWYGSSLAQGSWTLAPGVKDNSLHPWQLY
mmetsp:Transcript_3002/g.5372  ORF Transcript_3002/g.5372 Transcript_3002/m.5372 type:complete len:139 (-) Transcript_3002:480-896(-)